MYSCSHELDPYFDIFNRSEPTKEEINKSRLYQCKECKRWFSFLGHTKLNKAPNSD